MLIVMCKFVIWVVSSVGRASPLQGEGHWFKSSTTHHSLNGAYYKNLNPPVPPSILILIILHSFSSSSVLITI